MEAVQSRARLANDASTGSAARPAVPIRRADAEAALRSGSPIELTLDVVRRGDTSAREVNVTWDPAELEALLDAATGDEFALVFDPAELERAIEDPDVEAQGMREKAAILTVAIAALGAAGGASATPYGPGGSMSQAAGASGTGYVVPAGANQAVVNDAGTAGASGTGYVVPAGGTQALVDDGGMAGASGSGYVVPAGGNEALVATSSASGASVESGSSLSTGDDAAIAAGLALLITGAGFAAAKSMRRPQGPGLSPT
jgi:hypothetical protein